MSKIKKLDSSVYNKIAAGEVVERPSSVVKELVENALDAKADTISIFVCEGGLSEITVTDNGCGIEKDDLAIAFLPHATSKIATAEDLVKISSLGFRGEALASIASVATVVLKSRYYTEESGNLIKVRGGEIVERSPCGIAKGTIITVSNLFYNTPARLKFLKKPRYEEGEITSLIIKFILANPSIKFNYSNESGDIFSSQGEGLLSAIRIVYDKELVDSLITVNNIKGNYSVNGYVSNANYSKSNKTYQKIILNGRIINNITISTALHN
ncbi:MAG: DNA mismatch repair protein MutL, partial [Clostridia bacterium]|nr:DNA mismatch repair protein MutL [Clostridia bacterium]